MSDKEPRAGLLRIETCVRVKACQKSSRGFERSLLYFCVVACKEEHSSRVTQWNAIVYKD